MQTQLFIFRNHYRSLAGLLLVSNIAMGQNWVSSGPPGAPVIPFDAVITGRGNPPLPGQPKLPLYTCRGGTAEGYGVQVGKFTPGTTGCDFGYGGAEKSVPDFQFLVTSWEAASNGFVPPNAVQGGWDTPPPGSTVQPPLYYCRAEIKSGSVVSLQPGKIRPGFSGCLVPYSGREIAIGAYQVLVALNPAFPLANISAINGFVPQDAIRGGTDTDGTPLYICSAFFDGSTQLGKLHSSFGGCNISYGGVEYTESNYFVLVSNWLGNSEFDFPAGTDSDGSTLYVCRAMLNGGLIYPGKMRQGWNECSYGLSGKEQWGSLYEILSH
jgi:hypothetical protein